MENRIDTQTFYHGLDGLFASNQTQKAMEYLESWLTKAEAINDIYGEIAVLNEMGALCRAMGIIDRARDCYSKVRNYMDEMGLNHSESYATVLINEGDVYVNSGDLTKALTLFERARGILLDRGLGGSYQMAALCNNISMVYRRLDKLSEAEQALNTAFSIIRGLDNCIGELATTYVNLGELQVKQNKLRLAEMSFQEAIRIYEEKLNGSDVHYSAACSGLGEVYYLMKEYPRSVTYYKKAMELIERDFGRTAYYDMMRKNLIAVQKAMLNQNPLGGGCD